MMNFYTITGWIILILAVIGAITGGNEVMATLCFAMVTFMLGEIGEIKDSLSGDDS